MTHRCCPVPSIPATAPRGVWKARTIIMTRAPPDEPPQEAPSSAKAAIIGKPRRARMVASKGRWMGGMAWLCPVVVHGVGVCVGVRWWLAGRP